MTRRVRNTTARDSFSFLHLPLIAGIVLLALGVKKTLEDVDEPLKAVAAVGLCGGVALYLAADVAFRRRCLGVLDTQRLVAAAAVLVVIPLAVELPALVALACVCAVAAVLVGYEALRSAPSGDRRFLATRAARRASKRIRRREPENRGV